MSSPRIAISAARDRHRRSPSARWRQAWRRRLAPQRLCDSYANPAPARIPENYGRTVWPRPARSPAYSTRWQFAAAVLEAFLVPRGRVRNGRGRGPHRL